MLEFCQYQDDLILDDHDNTVELRAKDARNLVHRSVDQFGHILQNLLTIKHTWGYQDLQNKTVQQDQCLKQEEYIC